MRANDPTEWANNKKAAMEKAKRLREERKNGIVGAENATFTPQINKRPQYLNQPKDTLDNEVRLQTNDIFEQPLPGAAGKARQQQEFGGLPSPGSDALGREMKTHNAHLSNTGLGRSRHPDGLTDAQYKSKFLQQYETDKLQKQQNNGYGLEPEYAPPRQQPQQDRFEEQDDQFASMLRADAGKAIGPGWNDDTSSSGFALKKASVPQPANRHVIKKQTAVQAAPDRSHTTSYTNNYNNEQQQQLERQQRQHQQQYEREQQTRQPRQSSSRPPPRQLPEWNSGDDGGSFAIPDVPPPHRTTPKVVSPRGGSGASSGVPVPSCVMRSKLSLLKSKIRQSESSGGSRTDPNGPSPNSDGFGGGGMMKSNSSKASSAFIGGGYQDEMPVGDRRNTAPDMYGRAGGGGYDVEETIDYQRNPAVAAPRAGRRGPQPQAVGVAVTHQRVSDGYQHQQRQYDRYQPDQDQGGGYQPSSQVPTRRAAAPPRSSAGWNGGEENGHEYVGHQNRQQPPQRQPPAPAMQASSMMSEYPPGGGPPAEYLDAGDGSAGGPQFECPDCGRKFNEIPYQKHIKICQKVFQNKRKVFDSAQMRTKGIEDLEKVLAQAKKEEKKQQRQQQQKQTSAPSKSAPDRPAVAATTGGDGGKAAKWKEQSQAFREAMKAARNYSKAVATGAPLPPPVASAPDPSLIECPNCNRRFNDKAAERHIPLCKNIIAKPKTLVRGAGGGGGLNGAPIASAKRGKGKW